MRPEDILTFWFTEITPREWFTKDAVFDERMRERFLNVHEKALQGELSSWEESPEGMLALILILDQFSRNMFRDTPEAFASDGKALSLARKTVAKGYDLKVREEERQFFYMPYMHSESKEVHEEAAPLFQKLGNKSALRYEMWHKDIIDRFGRFPHRNSILGRVSTEEENAFLKEHSGF